MNHQAQLQQMTGPAAAVLAAISSLCVGSRCGPECDAAVAELRRLVGIGRSKAGTSGDSSK